MRPRRAIRTVFVYALLGALATILTSWAIHAARFAHVRSNATAPMKLVPGFSWPFHPARARRVGIDTTIGPGEIGVDSGGPQWAIVRSSRAEGAPYLGDAAGVRADALWRRHAHPSGRLGPLPAYPFPFPMFQGESTIAGWRVLLSDADVWNDAFDPEHGVINQTLVVVRAGWPFEAMEVGAHYARVLEMQPPALQAHTILRGYKRVEEIHRPPRLALTSGLELWAARPRPMAITKPLHLDLGVADRFALPLLPLWPGFLFNTFFYAILTFALVRTTRVLRRAVRRRRGRCVACGYDRSGLDHSAACPECGVKGAMGHGTGATACLFASRDSIDRVHGARLAEDGQAVAPASGRSRPGCRKPRHAGAYHPDP